ncbi:MAG TPA: hypothetical protein VJS18_21130 [Paraburkholderia sp.]|nr:hypothetical protein [Paraburkholderia sp.]
MTTKRVRGDNDAKDFVQLPRAVIAEVARLCREAPAGPVSTLHTIAEMIGPWNS